MSLFGDIIDLGSLGYNILSNERGRQDYLKQQQFSNQITSDSLYRGAQIRRQDLEAAGLHPTLAAGGAAHASAPVGSASQHPLQGHSRIMENALLRGQLDQQKAQINLLNAQAKKTETEAEYIPKQYEINYNKIMQEITMMGQEHEHRQIAYPIERALRTQQVRLEEVNEHLKILDRDYIRRHGYRMPESSKEWNDVKQALGIGNLEDAPIYLRALLGVLSAWKYLR